MSRQHPIHRCQEKLQRGKLPKGICWPTTAEMRVFDSVEGYDHNIIVGDHVGAESYQHEYYAIEEGSGVGCVVAITGNAVLIDSGDGEDHDYEWCARADLWVFPIPLTEWPSKDGLIAMGLARSQF